jgi:hypothetical protein
MAKEWFGVVLRLHEHQWLVEAPQLLAIRQCCLTPEVLDPSFDVLRLH